MTSKEALLQLESFCAYDDEIKEALSVIAKDLEVIEILRHYFQGTTYGTWFIDLEESDFDFEYECTREEWDRSPQKKIKEWLNKGRRNK